MKEERPAWNSGAIYEMFLAPPWRKLSRKDCLLGESRDERTVRLREGGGQG